MARQARRATAAPRLEPLEARTLLSGNAPGPVDPASSVFVRFAAGTTGAHVGAELKAVGGRVVTAYPDGPDLVSLAPGRDRAAALRSLRADPRVVYAEADGTFHASGLPATPAGPLTPNNPRYLAEWGLGMIDAPYAWSITTGTRGTIVAVLDTGIDLNNREFAGRVWTNPVANVDGYRGDTHGWNFVNGTGNVADDEGHGTHVSGILAAAGNNGTGIAGVDWGAQIMPLKILDAQGNGVTDSAVSAVYFAADHGARVINASWGGDAFSQAMLDALNYANSKGAVFVTAAGNDSANDDGAAVDPQNASTYPGSYRTANELVVAAVDPSGGLAGFSNFGPRSVDLAAPGVGIVSTVPGGFATYDGTSMATPFVSGTVALLAGLNPGMTAAQLVARVRATVKPLPALNGLLISPGVVDPLNALLDRQPLHPGSGTTPAPTATGRPSPPTAAASSPWSAVEGRVLASEPFYALSGGTATGFVAALYRAIDARPATPGELAYYAAAVQTGETRADLAGKLQNSQEGRLTRVARWYADDLGSTLPVAALKADPGVLAAANRLAAGAGAGAVLSQTLATALAVAGPAAATPGGAVAFLYRSLLNRPPDPKGLSAFSARLNAGATVAQVAQAILASPEGHLKTIADLYRDELGSRATVASLEADPGVASWAAQLGTD